MTTSFILPIILVILIAVGLRFYLLTPAKYHIQGLENLDKFFNDLVKYFCDGSVLLIKHKKTGKFIQFVKSINKDNKVNLHFGFPEAPWSQAYFTSIVESCKSEGYNIEFSLGERNSSVKKFLIINWLKVPSAMKLSILLFNKMGISINDKFVVHIDGMILKNTV